METKAASGINNAFYDNLGEMWYGSDDHPIALLRAENKARNKWVLKQLEEYPKKDLNFLDVGCGGGFLTNAVSEKGYKVTGIDLSKQSLEVAKKYDQSKRVEYVEASAYELPFERESFDVVSAMDILEHVEEPETLIREASRILKPGGLFLFHTFNRNPLSYLLIIKAVEWFVKNTPKNMHVYPLFIKPKELKGMCLSSSLDVISLEGLIPNLNSKAFWKIAITGKVPENFNFVFVKNTWTGYVGKAIKR